MGNPPLRCTFYDIGLHIGFSVGPCVEIWAPVCIFLVKVILINFQLEKHM